MPPPRVDFSRGRGARNVSIHEDIGTAVVRGVAGAVLNRVQGGSVANRNLAPVVFQPGADFEIVPNMTESGECPPGSRIARDACTGEIYCKKIRKRRKRLLTCSDKADIAFITGTLGKGALAQTAISSLLARCG